ncbi:MAG: GH25 family lysozyme [Lachnospiraceae bacterium]
MRKRHGVLALFLAGCLMVTAAPAQTVAEASDEMTAETSEEMTEEVSEEIEIDPQDPGRFRLTGKETGDVSFSEISTQTVSPAKKYSDCIIQKGIDVSYHNGTIDWKKVKKDGVDFAIIRVAYRGYENGRLVMDSKALENMKNANAAGVPIGVYIFSQAISSKEAVQEADYIVSKIKSYKIELPVVLDFEYVAVGVGRLYKAKLSKSAATSICTSFCKRVQELGYTPMVYASKSMYEDEVYAADVSQKYPVWLAHYTSGTTNYSGEYEYWQYSSSGTVDGIKDHAVDLNFRYANSLRITGKTSSTITMKWDAYEDAESYEIRRMNANGAYEYYKEVTDTTFTDTSLSPGKSYSYKIYAKDKCIGFNTGITALKATELQGKGTSFDKVKLNWSKVSGASAYYLQRYKSSEKTYSTVKKITGGSTISFIDGNKNASTTYQYRIRPYRVVFNGRTYGSYSNEIKVKTKKAVKGATKSKNINLRKSASVSSKKLGTLKKKGTKVTVIGSYGSWYRLSVKINGKLRTGYIKKNNIKLY